MAGQSPVIHNHKEIVATCGPAAHERAVAAGCLLLDVAVIIVKFCLACRDAAYTGRESCLLASIGHGLGVARGENVDIAVVVSPHRLVILGAEAPFGLRRFSLS